MRCHTPSQTGSFMNRPLPIFVSLILLLGGCATRYQSEGLTGGYSELQLAPDSFHICFYGNGFTSWQIVKKYVLLRASELTLKKGFKFFVVTSYEDQTSRTQHSYTHSKATGQANTYVYSNSASTQLSGSTSSSTSSGTTTKPAQCITIKCFKTRPDHTSYGEVFDAEFYWETNKVD